MSIVYSFLISLGFRNLWIVQTNKILSNDKHTTNLINIIIYHNLSKNHINNVTLNFILWYNINARTIPSHLKYKRWPFTTQAQHVSVLPFIQKLLCPKEPHKIYSVLEGWYISNGWIETTHNYITRFASQNNNMA